MESPILRELMVPAFTVIGTLATAVIALVARVSARQADIMAQQIKLEEAAFGCFPEASGQWLPPRSR